MKKITIVGPGRVGESTAQFLAQESMCRELVLLGRQQGVAQGIALDIQESAPLFGFDTRLMGSSDPAAMSGSDLVIISAGLPRKPGMNRMELLAANLGVLKPIVDHVLRFAPEALLLVVSNPVDVLTYSAWRQTGWDRSRVFGLSGVLDSARMAAFIALETSFSVRDINAMVIGGHGDTMLPLPRFSTINGIPKSNFLDPDTIARLVEHTRKGGAEILALKENSSAYDSPAAAIATMVDAIAHHRMRILPCVAVLAGEYGIQDAALGMPVVLGEGGMQKIVELPLTDEELTFLRFAAQQVHASLDGH